MKTLNNKIDWNNEVKNNPTRFDAHYYAELLVAPWFEDTDPRLFEFGDVAVKAYKCCPANGFTEKAKGWLVDFQHDADGHTQAYTERISTEALALRLAELYRVKADEDTPREDISEGTTVYPDDCLSEWHGRAAKVLRKYKADWGTWCLDLEFSDGKRYTYAEKFVLTHQPWSVVGATCKHRWTDTDVVLTITAAGEYYGIKAESEDGKVKWTGLDRDFVPCTPDGRELLPEPPAEIIIDEEPTLEDSCEISDAEDIESRKRTIVSRAKEGKQAWRMYNGYEVRVRTAYKNGHNDPTGWTYCVSWYEGEKLLECENGVTLEQAAKAMEDLPRWAELYKPSEITEKPAPSSWVTDYTADDFKKLESKYEIHEEDCDVMGKRYRLRSSGLAHLEIFVSDYAGNEKHALYYIWDEWANEVRANVRSLDYLRRMLVKEKGWERIAA